MAPDHLAALLRAHARQALAAAGITDPVLEEGLAATARERFLGPGPWRILRAGDRYARRRPGPPRHG